VKSGANVADIGAVLGDFFYFLFFYFRNEILLPKKKKKKKRTTSTSNESAECIIFWKEAFPSH
jgi:hypothetical protein